MSSEALWLFKQLNLHLEQEGRFQPREKGLSLIEAAAENENTLCPRQRNAKVEDLWSLTNFFGFATETFVLAVNILDRFLALMKVKPKHLSCIGVCCFQLAARVVEEECNIPSAHEIIRISQCKCTVSDLKRMEKIISEKLHFEFKATTALTFLHLYHTIVLCHTSERKEVLNLDKLEAQLKACNCRLVFSKAKPSVLALCLLTLEVQTLKSVELFEILLRVQKHSKVITAFGLSLQLLGLVQLVMYSITFKGPLLSGYDLYRSCLASAEVSNEMGLLASACNSCMEHGFFGGIPNAKKLLLRG